MKILFLKNSFSSFLTPMRVVKRFRKDEEGATAVEFALVAGPFFLLIFAILETAVFFWANQYLETIVDDVTRSFRTGNIVDRADFEDRVCKRLGGFFKCEDLIMSVDQAAQFVDVPAPPRTDNPANFQGGKFSPPQRFPPDLCPLTIVQVTASYVWPSFTNYSAPLVAEGLNNQSLINATGIIRTEDFTPQPGSNCP